MTFAKVLAEKYCVVADATLTLWHGGNLDVATDYLAHKGGRWEHGPGLYLTTHHGTAQKYAKGSRKLYRVTIAKGTDIDEVSIAFDTLKTFVDTYVVKAKRAPILERLQNRAKDGKVDAQMFVNMMIDSTPGASQSPAIRNTDTDKLRQFLVHNGIDYAIVDNAFGWHERMIVLFNMKKIVKKEHVGPKTKIEEFDLPTQFR